MAATAAATRAVAAPPVCLLAAWRPGWAPEPGPGLGPTEAGAPELPEGLVAAGSPRRPADSVASEIPADH